VGCNANKRRRLGYGLQEIPPFSKISKPALGTRLTSYSSPGILGVTLTTHLHPEPKIKTYGVIPSFSIRPHGVYKKRLSLLLYDSPVAALHEHSIITYI